LFFGPLDDVDRGEDSYSPLYQESRYCAACHEGIVFGVHAYSTYSEWLESPARREGKHCQTCHMRPTGTMTNVAPGRGGLMRDPRTLASHQFPGGQAEMLSRCLKVDVQLQRNEEGVTSVVDVRASAVGHKVPTGFVDRNLVLVVEGFDVEGKRVPSMCGELLPASTDTLAALPGKVYAKQLKDFDGHRPAPFWRAELLVEDTRLLPEQTDRTTFHFPVDVERVRVRLIYRRFWAETARTKGWPDDAVTVVDETFTVVAEKRSPT
jgi:hypothetical protein